MIAHIKTFIEFINQIQQLKIPIYQRKYSWEKETTHIEKHQNRKKTII